MPLEARSVSAIIPTRGDVDTSEIEKALRACPEIDDISFPVCRNVYGRYEAAAQARHDVVYTQDDDCIVEADILLGAFERGSRVLVHAMTPQHAGHYPGRISLVGFGAIFDRDLISRLDGWEKDELFQRECDRVFTALAVRRTYFPRIRNLAHASAPNRLFKQPEHAHARRLIEQRIAEHFAK
jgi:hypothetical protein